MPACKIYFAPVTVCLLCKTCTLSSLMLFEVVALRTANKQLCTKKCRLMCSGLHYLQCLSESPLMFQAYGCDDGKLQVVR